MKTNKITGAICDLRDKLVVGAEVETYADSGVTSSLLIRGIIGKVDGESFYIFTNSYPQGAGAHAERHVAARKKGFSYSWHVYMKNTCLITIFNNLKGGKMKLTEMYKNLFRKEPEKSFVKAGILNDDASAFTDEGQEIFLQWLLQKFGDEFKVAVVDQLLKDEEEKTK